MELKDGINKKFKKLIDKTNIWYIITISNKSSINLRRKNNGRKRRKEKGFRGGYESNRKTIWKRFSNETSEILNLCK